MLRSDSRVAKYLGTNGCDFLRFAMTGIERLLPDAETIGWAVEE
jgi:hypothetical protein